MPDQRCGPASGSVSVNYITVDGTAKAGSDYTSHSGTLRFGIGETSKTVTINITADSVFERDETFRLVISNPVNATITSNKSIIRILNDDIAAALSITPALDVAEGNSSYKEITLNVSLDKPAPIAISVNYSTYNGTAKAGPDYISQNGTLTFNPGQQNKTIKINITGDRYIENNENFSIVLSNPANARINQGTSTITIIDDDVAVCSRNQKIQSFILSRLRTRDCSTVTSRDLQQITTLNFRQPVNSLKAGDFDGLTNLSSLSIFNYSSPSLPSGIFKDLTNLTDLSIHRGSFSYLPSGIFDNLTRIRQLTLTAGSLSYLPSGIFDNLTDLRALAIQANSLSSLPPGIFDKNTRLRIFSVNNNNLLSLPLGVFDNTPDLLSVDLSGNPHLRLRSGTFANTTKLNFIYLSSGTYRNLPSDIFANLTRTYVVVDARSTLYIVNGSAVR